MQLGEIGRFCAATVLVLTAGACSSVSGAAKDGAMAAYREAHPGAGEVTVERAIPLADCDYVEVSGTAGVDHMTISRDAQPRVLRTAAHEGPEYFDSDYGPDELNKRCTTR